MDEGETDEGRHQRPANAGLGRPWPESGVTLGRRNPRRKAAQRLVPPPIPRAKTRMGEARTRPSGGPPRPGKGAPVRAFLNSGIAPPGHS
jgi:hypothetical protein